MPPKIDLVGKRFGRLIVIEECLNRKDGQILWKCKCDCGNYKSVRGNALKIGATTSCGCLQRELTSKRFRKYETGSKKLRDVFSEIKQRCLNPKCPDYYLYGGRGINICGDWLSDGGVQLFINWSLDNGYREGLSIDRINNDKDYSPDNCRWVNNSVQGRNKRTNHMITYKNKTLCMMEWAEITGIPYHTLKRRINKYGWSIEKALETPVRDMKRRKSDESNNS